MTANLLPVYSDAELAAASTARLIDLLPSDEDRAPRSIIDECARRGDEMLDRQTGLVADQGCCSSDCAPGELWLLLHAVKILGAMPEARGGCLFVDFMRRMSQAEDDDLQDWLAGDWPALFRNKPGEVLPALRAVCEDRGLDWYLRANALDVVVATAQWRGAEALDTALAWVAGIAAADSEDWELRLSAGSMLIDFPRATYRSLVEDLAQQQTEWGAYFSLDNVRDAYAAGRDQPQWERRDNPWTFYEPAAIAERQERWRKEDADDDEFPVNEDEDFFEDEVLTYVRPGPKIGRNDPCPCGSGKKYKRCCLSAR